MNKLYSRLANDSNLSGIVSGFGLTLMGAGLMLLSIGTYYKGVHTGVEARDQYYYEKEIKEYENRQGGCNKDSL